MKVIASVEKCISKRDYFYIQILPNVWIENDGQYLDGMKEFNIGISWIFYTASVIATFEIIK